MMAMIIEPKHPRNNALQLLDVCRQIEALARRIPELSDGFQYVYSPEKGSDTMKFLHSAEQNIRENAYKVSKVSEEVLSAIETAEKEFEKLSQAKTDTSPF